MSSENYSRIIREWCAVTGMQAWAEYEDMHIFFGDTLVGLIHDNSETPELLHVYIDLGRWDSPDIHRKLLEDNAPLGFPDFGCFGLHPATGSVIYRTRKLISAESTGENLLNDIKILISTVKNRLENSLMH